MNSLGTQVSTQNPDLIWIMQHFNYYCSISGTPGFPAGMDKPGLDKKFLPRDQAGTKTSELPGSRAGQRFQALPGPGHKSQSRADLCCWRRSVWDSMAVLFWCNSYYQWHSATPIYRCDLSGWVAACINSYLQYHHVGKFFFVSIDYCGLKILIKRQLKQKGSQIEGS